MNLSLVAVWLSIAPVAATEGECLGQGSAEADSADVWLISTRRLPSTPCPDDAQPDFWRLSSAAEWVEADQQGFVAADRPSIPTVFLIHGNRYKANDAAERGMEFCEELRSLAPAARFRLVIWSWPSDRISLRIRRDVRAKDVRSHQEALYLARSLDRIHPDVPVSLVGHSYGAQAIVGALRLLAGGCYAGHLLERRGPPRRAPLRAVLVAAAMEDYALADSEDPRSPLGQVDRLLITRNGRDRTLKYYPLLYRRHGPAALGFTGPSCLDGDEPNARKVEVVDLTQQAGRHHDWDVYRCASAFQARLAWYTLFVEPEGPETPQ